MFRTAAAASRQIILTTIAALLTVCVAMTGVASAQNYYLRSGSSNTQGDSGWDTGDATTPAYEFDGSEVLVEVGQDLQAAVDAHPAGTHFRIAEGVHRAQSVRPKDGNTFTGEPGAVMAGSVVLAAEGFARSGGVHVIGGQTVEGFFHGETMPGHERHAAPNELFLDGVRADHVNARGEVDQPGEWFFDYAADQVVMFDDPARFATVELSVVESAFRSHAADVTIQHLTITQYASPAQHGAIHAAEGRNWEVSHVVVSDAHGTGVRLGPGLHLHHSVIRGSGQLGVGGIDSYDGYQAPVVVEYNEIVGNRTIEYNWGWEGGATKFALTTDAVVRHNWVHHNFGPGIWFDVDNRDAVIHGNLVEHNDDAGVFIEISFGAEVTGNLIRHNGAISIGDMGAGVYVSSSRDIEIAHNTIHDNRSAVMAKTEDRGEGPWGTREVVGLNVHHNDITNGVVPTGLRVTHGDPDFYFNRAGNTFQDNTYRTDADGIEFYTTTHLDLAGWQGLGYDVAALTAPAGSAPQVPDAVRVLASATPTSRAQA